MHMKQTGNTNLVYAISCEHTGYVSNKNGNQAKVRRMKRRNWTLRNETATDTKQKRSKLKSLAGKKYKKGKRFKCSTNIYEVADMFRSRSIKQKRVQQNNNSFAREEEETRENYVSFLQKIVVDFCVYFWLLPFPGLLWSNKNRLY